MNKPEFYSLILGASLSASERAALAEHDAERNKEMRAQREALARVEAELSDIRHKAFTAAMARDTAQAQLAEAVGLLREHEWRYEAYDDYYNTESGDRCADCRAYKEHGHSGNCELGRFLAIQAQAEQQEAQSAQAGEFWAWLDLAYRDGSKGEGRNFTKYNMEVAYRAGTEAARAALATQPAVGEPVYQRYCNGEWQDISHQAFLRVQQQANKTETRILWTATPAAAHGDKVVLDSAGGLGFPDVRHK